MPLPNAVVEPVREYPLLAFVVAASVIWLAPRPTRTVDMSQAGH